MFSEAFNEIIGPGNFPCCQKMGLGTVGLLQAHVVHHRYQMQVDGGNGVTRRPHGKDSLYNTRAVLIFPFK